jgi:hypothetical protein
MGLSAGTWAGIIIVSIFVLVGIFLLIRRLLGRRRAGTENTDHAAIVESEDERLISRNQRAFQPAPGEYGKAIETATGKLVEGRWEHEKPLWEHGRWDYGRFKRL